VYKESASHSEQAECVSLALSHIAITPPDSSLIRVLRSAVTTGPGISGIRFSRNTIDGTYIEDSYIYRLVAREFK